MTKPQKLLAIAGLVLFAAVLALTFRAYLSPMMLLDFVNLQFCS